MKRANIFLPVYAALLLGLVGCNDTGKNNRLSIYVCDAPAPDFQEVKVTVTAMEVLDASTSGQWVSLPVQAGELSLLTLTNGTMQKVAMQDLPEGITYDAVRFTFSTSDASVTIGGQKQSLSVASQDAVVEVAITPTLLDGDIPLLFDMNAATSVVDDGSGGYKLTPDIKFLDQNSYGVVQGGLRGPTQAMTTQVLILFTERVSGTYYTTYSSIVSGQSGAFFVRLPPGDYYFNVIPGTDVGYEPYSGWVTLANHGLVDMGWITLTPITL